MVCGVCCGSLILNNDLQHNYLLIEAMECLWRLRLIDYNDMRSWECEMVLRDTNFEL